MRMTIRVRQEHIDRGVPGSASGCPIALAILEGDLAGGPTGILTGEERLCRCCVGLGAIFLETSEGRELTSLSNGRVDTFIRRFDGGRDVRPAVFYVEVAEELPDVPDIQEVG